jgi:hypothetical protein
LPGSRSPARGAEPRDAFPHTRRPLPWFLAGFLAMVFFIPIDATELKFNIGVDSHPDRLGVVVLVLAWIWFGGDQHAFMRTRRSKLFVTAVCVFLTIAVASLLLDAPRIINLNDFQLAEKRFALLGSLLILGWFALTALRFEDLRGFASYLIGLAVLLSIGMLVERHTGFNVFYEWSRELLRPIATVAPSPTDIHPSPNIEEGRIIVVGPTLHGLAATAMLVMVMPFALVRVLEPTSRRSWWLNVIAILLMAGAAVATDRKTALLVPLALLLYTGCYRPRQVLRLVPVGLVVFIGLAHVAAPGTLGTLLNVNADVTSGSTAHREGDFTDLRPDVLAHPLLGRGYGSIVPDDPSEFRINDDQYLDELWEVGVIGLLAFVWMILAPVVLARSAIRSRGPTASLALAASGGCVAFLVVCALFDSMGFTEAPYMFFLVAAFTTIAAAGPEGNVEPSGEFARKLAARRGRAAATAGVMPLRPNSAILARALRRAKATLRGSQPVTNQPPAQPTWAGDLVSRHQVSPSEASSVPG